MVFGTGSAHDSVSAFARHASTAGSETRGPSAGVASPPGRLPRDARAHSWPPAACIAHEQPQNSSRVRVRAEPAPGPLKNEPKPTRGRREEGRRRASLEIASRSGGALARPSSGGALPELHRCPSARDTQSRRETPLGCYHQQGGGHVVARQKRTRRARECSHARARRCGGYGLRQRAEDRICAAQLKATLSVNAQRVLIYGAWGETSSSEEVEGWDARPRSAQRRSAPRVPGNEGVFPGN